MTAATKSSAPLAQALLAGLLQGQGERDGDSRMVEAGKRLAAATKKKLATRGASDATTTTRSRRARWFGARLSGRPRH